MNILQKTATECYSKHLELSWNCLRIRFIYTVTKVQENLNIKTANSEIVLV